ncbi:MBL fold metallo-hydrolase [Hymenobacter metallicola]|uniref:Twin-arginine translocation pathway signal n=1 Tax=Hymenobacter metallicola TaxID=2563114 RepID=A0A4Z0PTJ1_9BACT|nr:MBL fold metallo-hydrolase [Hymenobacter metallicola]TGE21038.1 twin-arginine translocation pathway signal [Hymenobacter metallicola]
MSTSRRIFLWTLSVLALLAAGGFIIGCSISAPRYAGPRSDHFDGKQFQNAGGVHAQEGLRPMLRWMLHREKGPFPEQPAAPYGPKPPARVSGGQLRVTFVNHGTFLLQVDGLNILTDPIWSERTSPYQWIGPKRLRPPGLRFEDLPKIDVVLISHNHYDHLDVGTLRRLVARDQPRIFAGLGVAQFLTEEKIPNATDLEWWQQVPLSAQVKLNCVPAQHFSGRGLRDRDATLWAGYVLQTSAGNLYYAGDTGYGQFFAEIGRRFAPMRLAILPIGAYRPQWFMAPIHISPAEAVQAHLDVQARQSVATHFGTFQLADDGLTEPVTDLRRALQEKSVPDSTFLVLKEGVGWTAQP